MRGVWRLRRLWNRSIDRVRLLHARLRVALFATVRNKKPHGLRGELIVSLTSYPPRFATLSLTLRSLLDQTVAADRTILWLTPEDQTQLPRDVTALVEHGLEIRNCEDLKSYKKLVPALVAFPDADIVTADDDLYYPPGWLAQLVEEALAWPGRIISHRAHLAFQRCGGGFLPYEQWELETSAVTDEADGALLFPTGGAGTLYPAKSLHPLVTRSELFMKLCPTADDVWFFWMSRLAGTPQRRIARRAPLIPWDGSQDVALYRTNLLGRGNDVQIAAMHDHFDVPTPESLNDARFVYRPNL